MDSSGTICATDDNLLAMVGQIKLAPTFTLTAAAACEHLSEFIVHSSCVVVSGIQEAKVTSSHSQPASQKSKLAIETNKLPALFYSALCCAVRAAVRHSRRAQGNAFCPTFVLH